MNKPKILLFDVENTPSTAYIWSLWTETTTEEMIDKSWYMLCWAAKWLGSKEIMSSALIDFPKEYKKNPENDKPILQKLWSLLDEADIVIGHNALDFDTRKANARFIINGMKPPSPYKVIDTLKVARKYFYFTSNKLTDLGKYLKVGEKIDTGGFKLWKNCMNGDKKSWEIMIKYNKHDIILLEDVYLKLRPYIMQHPNLGTLIDSERAVCPKCSSCNIQYRGHTYTSSKKYRRFICSDCGGWSREVTSILELDKRKKLLTNAN